MSRLIARGCGCGDAVDGEAHRRGVEGLGCIFHGDHPAILLRVGILI
jgi:hypothetical protein